MVHLALAAALLLASPAARADEDPAAVLVASLQVDAPALRPDADRLRDLLLARLSPHQDVLAMADVPAFQAYGAEVYLQACPPEHYVDCAFVLGQRAGAGWVIGGALRAEPGALVVRWSFVEVDRAALVLQLDVPFDGSADPEAADAVAAVLAGLQARELQTVDVRLDPGAAPAEPPVDADELAVAAEALAALEEAEGEVLRADRRRALRRRITAADLQRWEGSEATPPWEQARLPRAAWVRWQRSGRPLADFRYRARGRQGEILVGFSAIGLAWGPWQQVQEGWYTVDDHDLSVTGRYVLHDLAPGLLRTWELSVAGGVLPWLDVGAFGGPRVAPWRGRVQRVVEGETLRPADATERPVTSWHLGGRVTVAPLPAAVARPLLQVGVLGWWGTRVRSGPDELPRLPRSRMVLLQAAPGIEVTATRHLLLWVRADVEVPLARRVAGPFHEGGGAYLDGRPAPHPDDENVSVGGSVGATVRIRVRPRGGGPRRHLR